MMMMQWWSQCWCKANNAGTFGSLMHLSVCISFRCINKEDQVCLFCCTIHSDDWMNTYTYVCVCVLCAVLLLLLGVVPCILNIPYFWNGEKMPMIKNIFSIEKYIAVAAAAVLLASAIGIQVETHVFRRHHPLSI